AFFQSVNARTSGFNSLPIRDMANETLFILMVLMFIGASPGSCGGGVKTTTIATLAVVGISRFRGKHHPQIFGRSLSQASINKAVSVVLISAFIVCSGVMLLLIAQLGDLPHPQSRGEFLELFFELVSAFGTVGLSTGATESLTPAGKVIIVCTMFIGRLGPLVTAVAMSRSLTSTYYYPEETIMVG
ncbi:MAG: potassium transporter TrkG, partial [Desulfobacterales bacterium]|nr:potassium transporter TrkG [Desulfobacterales bacterium]